MHQSVSNSYCTLVDFCNFIAPRALPNKWIHSRIEWRCFDHIFQWSRRRCHSCLMVYNVQKASQWCSIDVMMMIMCALELSTAYCCAQTQWCAEFGEVNFGCNQSWDAQTVFDDTISNSFALSRNTVIHRAKHSPRQAFHSSDQMSATEN